MHYLLWFFGGLGAWLLFGFIWCRLFDKEDEDEYQECPYE